MPETYGESYFEGFEAGYRLDPYKVWYWEVLSRYIRARGASFDSCLDVGCAYGYFVSILGQKLRPSLIVGIDTSLYAAKMAKKVTRAEIVVASSTALPFRDETFDLVTALELIEHLSDAPAHFFNTYASLKKDGLYFASSPNRLGTGQLLDRVGLLKGNPTHVKLFTARELSRNLRAIGFERLFVRTIQVGIPLPGGRFVTCCIPMPFGTSIVVSCRKL